MILVVIIVVVIIIRRSVYNMYKALREMDLSDSKSVIMPLVGFDWRIERGSAYEGKLKDDSRKTVRSHRAGSPLGHTSVFRLLPSRSACHHHHQLMKSSLDSGQLSHRLNDIG
jgi:hypothetical protein